MLPAKLPLVLRLATLAAFAAFAPLTQVACATTHEEPPAPPPPPVDPAAFNGPARPPAANVDIGADLDAGNLWADAEASDAGASSSGSSVTPAPSAPAKPAKSGKP